MRNSLIGVAVATTVLSFIIPVTTSAQRGGALTDSARARRWAIETELSSLAVIDRKVMIPMRDGIRIAADIYRPRDTHQRSTPLPGCARPTTSTSGTSRMACRAT